MGKALGEILSTKLFTFADGLLHAHFVVKTLNEFILECRVPVWYTMD